MVNLFNASNVNCYFSAIAFKFSSGFFYCLKKCFKLFVLALSNIYMLSLAHTLYIKNLPKIFVFAQLFNKIFKKTHILIPFFIIYLWQSLFENYKALKKL